MTCHLDINQGFIMVDISIVNAPYLPMNFFDLCDSRNLLPRPIKKEADQEGAYLTSIPQLSQHNFIGPGAQGSYNKTTHTGYQRWLPRWSARSSWSSCWRLPRAMPRCCRPLAAASTAATASPNVVPHGTARPWPPRHHLLCRPLPLLPRNLVPRLGRSWLDTSNPNIRCGVLKVFPHNFYLAKYSSVRV
jgi:hypothetical protein